MTSDNDVVRAEHRSRDDLRQELIEAAGEMLRSEGAENFSTTKVAEACQTSTQMIYTFFDGKSGLLEAVYENKASELVERFEAMESEDPLEEYFELGLIYREFMLEHQALFDAVFSLEAANNYKGEGSLVTRVEPFEKLDDILVECQEAGIVPEDKDPEHLTNLIWAGVNGIIRLQIIGFYPDDETAKDHFTELATSFLVGECVENPMDVLAP